jgi:hypothetical protein
MRLLLLLLDDNAVDACDDAVAGAVEELLCSGPERPIAVDDTNVATLAPESLDAGDSLSFDSAPDAPNTPASSNTLPFRGAARVVEEMSLVPVAPVMGLLESVRSLLAFSCFLPCCNSSNDKFFESGLLAVAGNFFPVVIGVEPIERAGEFLDGVGVAVMGGGAGGFSSLMLFLGSGGVLVLSLNVLLGVILKAVKIDPNMVF